MGEKLLSYDRAAQVVVNACLNVQSLQRAEENIKSITQHNKIRPHKLVGLTYGIVGKK